MGIEGEGGLNQEKNVHGNAFNLQKEILENLDGDQQFAAISVLESIRTKGINKFANNVEKTKSGLIKIHIVSNVLSLDEKKSPITIVIKKDGKVNVRIDQHQYYDEFYYMHLNTDYTSAISYVEGFDRILQGKSPDEIFGKGNHRLEKKEYNVPGGDINYYHEGKHMDPGFKSKNERFNSGEFDTKK